MLSKPLKAQRIYCTLDIVTKLKRFEIIKAKCNLVMTEIFWIQDLGFISSLLVAPAFYFLLVIEFPETD